MERYPSEGEPVDGHLVIIQISRDGCKGRERVSERGIIREPVDGHLVIGKG